MFFKRKKYVAAVIVAAGESQRMGGDKMLFSLCGIPVILHTLYAFERSKQISEIVLVTREDMLESMARLAHERGITKLTSVVRGGETRTQSVQNGITAVSKRAGFIAVHDGARPLVTDEIIGGAVLRAQKFNAAAPAVPVKATIKRAKNSVVINTPERSELYEIQTPQVFAAELIKGALAFATKSGKSYSDDCLAVEAIGAAVHLSKGSYENIKLTTPEDMILAEAIVKSRLKEMRK